MSITEFFLVVGYTVLLCLILIRLPFFKRFNLSPVLIAGIFIFKTAMGIVYGIILKQAYQGGDTFSYFTQSGIVYGTLSHDPWLYLRLVFGPAYAHPAADIVPYKDLMWYYTTPGSYLLVRFNALARLISFGYYNVHVVFYNFITLTGLLFLFRFFCLRMPGKKYLLAACIFFFPSIAFWSSGMHKDGVSLAALGLILYSGSKIFTGALVLNASSIKWWIILFASILLLLTAHNFLLLLLLPVLTAFLLTLRFPGRPLLKYAIIGLLYFGVASNLNNWFPQYDFLNRIVLMQGEFKAISENGTRIAVPEIIPTISSVAAGIPMGLCNSLLEPLPASAANLMQLAAALMSLIVLACLPVAFFFRKKAFSLAERSLICLCFGYAFLIFTVVGITVPIVGALVRYKMCADCFWLLGCVLIIRSPSPSKLQGKQLAQ